ncbi:MAG: hypothetical protein HZC28_08345 [Spirochaetes bacterium]|nr:hypothetical protein [Spirochaetota bacterium]
MTDDITVLRKRGGGFRAAAHSVFAARLKMKFTAHYRRVSGKPAPSGFTMTLHERIGDVPHDVWNGCNRKHDVFLSTEYLAAVEETPPHNMRFRYAVFSDASGPAGIAYYQLVTVNPNMHQPAVFQYQRKKQSVADKVHEAMAGAASVRFLFCGNAMLSGEHGYSFAEGVSGALALTAVVEAAYRIRSSSDVPVNVTIVKDFYDRTAHDGDMLRQYGFYSFDAGPNMAVPVDPAWNTFDDYVKCMKPKYRRRVNGVIAKGRCMERRTLDLEALTARQDVLHALYGDVADKARFRLFTLPPAYFTALKKHLGDRFVCDIYTHENSVLGFTTRIINGDETEGYAHGLDYEQNKTYELYQNILLDDIRAGISSRIARINTGRTSAAMKSSFGAVPDEMKCYIRFSGRISNQVLKLLFSHFRPSREFVRNPFGDE